MGHMDVLSLLSDGFNVYFPMGILVVSLFTWFRVGSRVLNYVGIQQFQQFLVDDEISVEFVSEGREIISRGMSAFIVTNLAEICTIACHECFRCKEAFLVKFQKSFSQ